MDNPSLEERDGMVSIRGSRIPLDGLVLNWRDGYSPEEIRDNFPSLTLAEVYGAVAYYLDHPSEVEQQLRESEARFERQRAAEAADPERYARLRQRFAAARARREPSTS